MSLYLGPFTSYLCMTPKKCLWFGIISGVLLLEMFRNTDLVITSLLSINEVYIQASGLFLPCIEKIAVSRMAIITLSAILLPKFFNIFNSTCISKNDSVFFLGKVRDTLSQGRDMK